MAVSELSPAGPAAATRARRSAGASALKLGRRWLYVLHRWLGIFTCLLCAVWFVSGVVMMYVPFPSLTERDRMAWSEPLDLRAVRVGPEQAVAAAGLRSRPTGLRLNMQAGEPTYRFAEGRRRVSVSAADGRRLGVTDAAAALAVIRRLRPDAPRPRVETIVRDQWTVAQGFDPHRPLHRVSLGDAAGTQAYVSSKTGEVVDETVRSERFWNWVGAVPHWIYFEAVRRDGQVWRQVVMWSSGPAIIGSVLGIWVGLLRLRLRRRYKHGRVSPYVGWMKWHHVAGLVAGLFVCTWLFSGWLSVNPFKWFDRQPASREGTLAYLGGEAPGLPRMVDAAVLARLDPQGAREIAFGGLGGRPLMTLIDPGLRRRVLDGATGAPAAPAQGEILAAASRLVPGARIVRVERLTREDLYWYGHGGERPAGRLPVLRVAYDDPEATWAHIDPATGEVLQRAGRSARTYRWLFNFLHDFDLPVLLHHRPLWDLLVWLLSIGGLVVSVSGVVIGWRRLGRKLGGSASAVSA